MRISSRRTTRIRRIRKKQENPENPKSPISSVNEDILKDARTSSREVYIVGGGPSLENFDFSLLADKCTITINKSIFHVPDPNYFISVDYTFLRKVSRAVFNPIPAKKFFVADFSHPFLKEVDKQITDTRHNMAYDLSDYDILIRAHKQEGIGYTFKEFRTGRNSGFCAFQLAVILGFTKIYLLGIDLNKEGKTHYHEGYGERPKTFVPKLDEYYNYFKMGLEQLQQERPDIQVISCSANSRLNDIIQYWNSEEVFK